MLRHLLKGLIDAHLERQLLLFCLRNRVCLMTHPVSNQILQVTVAAGLRLVTDIVLNLATLAHYESISDPAVIR